MERRCSKYVIAYIDLLCVTDKLTNCPDKILGEIYELYEDALDFCKKDKTGYNAAAIEMKAFSDNVVFAYKVREYSPGAVVTCFGEILVITQFVAYFQFLALQKGMLLRGGITIGDLYIDDAIILGNGLVRAYYLENNIAIYPRIVVDYCVVDELEKTRYEGGNKYDACKIASDNDFSYYIDYLKPLKKADFDLDLFICKAYYDIRCDEKDEPSPNRIHQKIGWQINYMQHYLSFDLADEKKYREFIEQHNKQKE